MVVVSYSGKEINAKLVYYGAGLSGKTTNLESIYEAVPDTSRGKMVSMKTQSDRTLFFDLLPLDLGEIMGFRTRFLLYTVPGQVFYNATRKLVLKGADAIVFVADSEVGKMEENKESLDNLKANLAEYKLNLDDLPWVIQYNKRDLPNVYTCEELNAELNPSGVPHFEAVATQGKGVFETFRGISHLLMEKVTKDLRRVPGAAPPRPAAALDESIRARPQVTPPVSAPPQAPTRTVTREPVEEPAAAHRGGETAVPEYGRQIELPDGGHPMAKPAPVAADTPKPAPVAADTPKPAPVTAGTRKPAPVPSPLEAATPASPSFATPLPASRVAERTFAAPALSGPDDDLELIPVPSAFAPVPAHAPVAFEPVVGRAAASPQVAEAGEAATVVVPVSLPANGQTTEIVIRIVFKPVD